MENEMSHSSATEFLDRVKKSFHRDYDENLPPGLVVSSSQAAWLDQAKLKTPARIGPLPDLPARRCEICLQEIEQSRDASL
jgi:hypothetical protein